MGSDEDGLRKDDINVIVEVIILDDIRDNNSSYLYEWQPPKQYL